MKPVLSAEQKAVVQSISYAPAITLVMPFEPKMVQKHELEYQLKLHQQKAEQQLLEKYSSDIAVPVIQKLQHLIKKINFNSYRRSLVIHVSSHEEKVLYLEMELESRLMMDQPFSILQVLSLKKEKRKFVVLQLGSHQSNFYLYDGRITRLRSNSLSHTRFIKKYKDLCQFNSRTEIFLRYTDEALDEIVVQNPYPVFVIGNDINIRKFKEQTVHSFNISGFISAGDEELNERKIRALLKATIGEWKIIHQQNLLVQAETAFTGKRLARGIDEVIRQVKSRNGKLLLIEKKEAPLKDEVMDTVLEMAVMNGCDIEFVDAGLLHHFGQIALILRNTDEGHNYI
jgi:hypothetical protein